MGKKEEVGVEWGKGRGMGVRVDGVEVVWRGTKVEGVGIGERGRG